MVDNEHAYSPSFAEKLGLDSKKLIYTNPESLEDCFETIEKVILAIRKKDKDTPIMIGYDSIGTSPTKKEMDDDFGKNSEMGGALRAKVAGQCLRRINPLLRKYKAGLIIINQVRSKVGVMFGDPRTRAGGGKALLYYCGTSLETASGKSDQMFDERKNPLGITGTIKAVKNKITKPFQTCEFKLLYDKGIEPEYGLTEQYYKDGKASKPSPGWFSLDNGATKHRKGDLDSKIAEDLKKTMSSILYGVISIPIFAGALWYIFNLVFSPIIVANNLLNEFFPTEKVEEPSNTSEKPSDTLEKLEYDPKYKIEDPIQFKEEGLELKDGDVVFEDDKMFRVSIN